MSGNLNHGKRLLLDAFGGMGEYIYSDHGNSADMLIKTVQDCSGVVEENKILSDQPQAHKDWTLVARVPIIFADKAMREGWFDDEGKWKEFLNDPDHAAFRIWKGRV